jgi:SanA protein
VLCIITPSRKGVRNISMLPQVLQGIGKVITYILVACFIFLLLFSHFCNAYISRFSRDFIFQSIDKLPSRRVALVLGTSKYLQGGSSNPYFSYRMDAAAKLFFKGKVDIILASGDNSKNWYNEPLKMKEDLLRAGVPEWRVHLDYAGFRTLDSIIRAKQIFGVDTFVIISQHFHNQRAVFIARALGLDAYGYDARDVTGRRGIKTRVREYFAKVKAFMDIYMLKTQPKFLGEKIGIY